MLAKSWMFRFDMVHENVRVGNGRVPFNRWGIARLSSRSSNRMPLGTSSKTSRVPPSTENCRPVLGAISSRTKGSGTRLPLVETQTRVREALFRRTSATISTIPRAMVGSPLENKFTWLAVGSSAVSFW